MSLGDAWHGARHARPQLFVKCLLRPHKGRLPKNATWTRGPNDMEAVLCYSAPLRSSSCLPQGQCIAPPPSCTSHPSPLLQSCTLPPAILCLEGCHSFPASCKATLLPPYLISCGTSRPARFSSGSPTQPLWMAVGGARCMRSTHGCGSMGAGSAWAETEDRRGAVVSAGSKRNQETRRRRGAARHGDE